jgi:hypothetical protein
MTLRITAFSLLLIGPLAAHRVTVTRPGAPPPTFACAPAPGCSIDAAPQPPPPPTALWRLDLADTRTITVHGVTLPRYGFTSRRVSDSSWAGTYYTESLTPAACPTGGPALRFSMRPYEGQRYVGGSAEVAAPAWGESRFYYGLIRYHMDNRTRPHTQKLLVVAQPATDSRPILTIGTHLGEPRPLQMRLQLDGGARRVDSQALATDRWIQWQVEINPGQSGASSGYYVLTVDGREAGRSTGISFTDAMRRAQGSVDLGFFLNDPVYAGDGWWFEICDAGVRRGG